LKPVFSEGTKIYDGTYIEFNLQATLSGILGLDMVNISGYTTIFKSNQTGYQLIDISNFIIYGPNAFNYYITSIQPFMGYIQAKDLIIAYTSSQQTYTGFSYTNYNVTYNGFVSTDSPITLSGILAYAISTSNLYNINPEQVNWIAIGSGISYSIDGINWSNVTNNVFSIYGSSVETNNSMWVAVGTGTNTIAYSYNGINWVGLGNTIFSQAGLSVTYSNNIWFATGQGINTIAYSYNGINWISISNQIFTSYVRDIYANKVMTVAVGEGLNTIAYTYNRITWFGLGNTILDSKGISIINNNILWLAMGEGSQNTMAYSYNGINWFGLGRSIFTNYANYGIWDGSKFIVVGSGTNTIAYSYDGIHWISLGNTILLNTGLELSYNGNYYIAIGTNNTVKSYNGINWFNFNLNINLPVSIKSTTFIQFIYYDKLINAGSYNIIPGGLYGKNYYIIYELGITNITKAKLQISHNNYHKIYNALKFTNYGVTYTGFVNTDTSMNLTGTLQFYSNTNTQNVGSYFITPSGLLSINYDITYTHGKLDIIKAPLVIRTNNNVKIYDTLAYNPTYTVYGLLQNDSINDLSGILYFYGPYLNNINVGTYNVFLNGLTSYNYDIKYIQDL